jgi:hypothetical protein
MEIKVIGIEQDLEGAIQEKIVTFSVTFDNGVEQFLNFAVPIELTDEEAIAFANEQAKDVITYLETQSCEI